MHEPLIRVVAARSPATPRLHDNIYSNLFVEQCPSIDCQQLHFEYKPVCAVTVEPDDLEYFAYFIPVDIAWPLKVPTVMPFTDRVFNLTNPT